MSKLEFAQKVCPEGYQIISEVAISYLYHNHPEAYKGFYERVSAKKIKKKELSRVCLHCNHTKGSYKVRDIFTTVCEIRKKKGLNPFVEVMTPACEDYNQIPLRKAVNKKNKEE